MCLNYSCVDDEKEIFEVEIAPEKISVTKEEIESNIGYPVNSVPEHFSKMIDEVVVQMHGRYEVYAGYRIINLNKDNNKKNSLAFDGIIFNTGKIVTGQLWKAERAAIFAVTIGPGMELWSKELIKNGEILKGYLADTAASVAVENAADLLHNHVGEWMRDIGTNITNRYSPGYCNWNVSEQQKLFSLLPPGFCGIKLTESSLMLPVKSISGIIGIGKNVRFMDYICETCKVPDCTYKEYFTLKKKYMDNHETSKVK